MAIRPQTDHEWIESVVRSEGPRVAYGTIISTFGLIVAIFGGIWAVNQSQLTNIDNQIKSEHAQFQQLFANVREELARRENELRAELARRENELRDINSKQDFSNSTQFKNIQDEFDRRRDQFTQQQEFKQFQSRVLATIDTMQRQLAVLEQTHPTTGELKATTDALRDRIEKLYALLDRQQEWIRSLHIAAPPPPPTK